MMALVSIAFYARFARPELLAKEVGRDRSRQIFI